MPTPGINLFISPISQNVTWARNTPLPVFSVFGVSSTNTAYVTYVMQFDNTSVDWLSLSGDVDPQSSEVLMGSGDAQITPVPQDLNLLTGSFYSAKIRFTAGTVTRIHTVNLTITGEFSPIKTEKPNYSLVFNRITNTLSGDTLVNILNNTVPDDVSFETLDGLFLEKTATTDFTLEEDPVNPLATSPELPTIGTKLVSCRLKNAAGTILYTFTVSIQVVNTNDISTDLPAVNFSIYKHLSETKSQVLQIINPANLDFTITAPDFVSLNTASGNTTANIEITTDNSADLLAQEYTGNIVISYGSKTLNVPVTVKNVDFIDLKTADYNFCLDDFTLTVQKINNAGKFVKISLEIMISTAKENYTVSPGYQIAYFNGAASTNLGKKIHNHFPVFDGHLFEKSAQVDFNNQKIYDAAKVNVKIEELNSDYEVIFTKSIQNLKMFPGRKPKMFPLFTNSQIKSRYFGSGYIFSYLSNLVAPEDIVQNPVSSNSFAPDQVQSVFFDDADALIDFAEYRNILGIDFLMMPKGDQQIFVQFINQNLVPELAVFNGFYEIEDEFSHTYDDFENAEKHDTKSVKKLKMNTGFLLKEESAVIQELARSVISYVKIYAAIYKCLPIPGKIAAVNSETNLVNFELEFLIVKEEHGN